MRAWQARGLREVRKGTGTVDPWSILGPGVTRPAASRSPRLAVDSSTIASWFTLTIGPSLPRPLLKTPAISVLSLLWLGFHVILVPFRVLLDEELLIILKSKPNNINKRPGEREGGEEDANAVGRIPGRMEVPGTGMEKTTVGQVWGQVRRSQSDVPNLRFRNRCRVGVRSLNQEFRVQVWARARSFIEILS